MVYRKSVQFDISQNIWWKRAVLLSSAVTADVRSARLQRAHRLWVADATDWQRRRWFADRAGSTLTTLLSRKTGLL